MVPPQFYTGTRFQRNRFFDLCKFIINNAYITSHIRQKVKMILNLKSTGSEVQI